jgi:peptidoglycan hydrolase-like protein with peptidoglycan-binding domain
MRGVFHYVLNIPTSLLIIVSLLFSAGRLYGDERIREAQEQLRKRHLFFGETTGESSPALAAAIGHYQKKKGFTRTGCLDPETCASLGVVEVATAPAQTPFVVADTGDLHGPNGETLPSFLELRPPGDERAARLNLATTNDQQVALSLARTDTRPVLPEQRAPNRRSRGRSPRIQPRKETNPLVIAFNNVNRAMKLLVGDAQPKRKRTAAKRL